MWMIPNRPTLAVSTRHILLRLDILECVGRSVVGDGALDLPACHNINPKRCRAALATALQRMEFSIGSHATRQEDF